MEKKINSNKNQIFSFKLNSLYKLNQLSNQFIHVSNLKLNKTKIKTFLDPNGKRIVLTNNFNNNNNTTFNTNNNNNKTSYSINVTLPSGCVLLCLEVEKNTDKKDDIAIVKFLNISDSNIYCWYSGNNYNNTQFKTAFTLLSPFV